MTVSADPAVKLEALVTEAAETVTRLGAENQQLSQEIRRLRMMLQEREGLEIKHRRLSERLKKLMGRVDKELAR